MHCRCKNAVAATRCDVVESAVTVRAECHFERQYIGRWMLFDDDSDTESTFDVSSGEVQSSTLGSFICKGKHWQLPYYKVLSVFDNSWCVFLQDSCNFLIHVSSLCSRVSRAVLCKHGLCRHAVSVCVSVRLSATFADSVETNKHIINFFHCRVATPF